MENIQIPLQKDKKGLGLKRFFYRDNPIGIGILLIYSLLLGWLITYSGLAVGIILPAAIAGLPLAYIIVAYPKAGISVLLFVAYFIMFLPRFGPGFPVGVIMDCLEGLLILGFFIKQKYHSQWNIYKNPVSILLLVWLIYNILQVINPDAASQLAWLAAIRTTATILLMYYVFLYQIRDVRFIRWIVKLWIFLTFIAAVYTFKQEYFGFSSFESESLKDPLIASLYLINDHWRKFSIFSDPVALAYNMVISSILCLCLMTGPLPLWKKWVLGSLAIFFLAACLFSGTRGAYVLVPASLLLLCILKLNIKTIIYGVIGLAVIVALIVMPTSNPTIQRFQSAFYPSKDASFNVRKSNQEKIKPYILSHPMGGGLGSTGLWGQRFSPGTYLASFPPDSGYVRVAVEEGWIGLLILCILMVTILFTGINNFYRIRDPELKSYCLAMTVILFALNLGNYPQEALTQFPINIYFYLAIALIQVTRFIDRDKNKETSPAEP